MNVKNKKGLFLGLLSLLVSIPLAACNSNSSTTEVSNQVLITGAKSLEIGETLQLSTIFTVEEVDVLWASLNPTVATVNSSGLVTALDAGTATIVVQASGDSTVTDSVEIDVIDPTVLEAEYVHAYFYDYDGTLLDEDIVVNGDTPRYSGDTPTRLSDASNSYIFIGWDKEIESITEDTEYVAQYEATPITDFVFSMDIANGGYTIDGYTGSSLDVVVPSSYNYRNVVAIGDSAFYATSITSITLPDTIVSIGDSAFYSCTYLENCNLPSGVTYIGSYAFYYCEALNEFYEFDEGLAEISDYAFYNCSSLRYFSAPGLKTIGDCAFANCYVLNFEFNEGLESIGAFAFQWNRTLRTVVLPSTVTYLGESVFCHAQGITTLTLSDNLETIDYNSSGYQSLVLDCINLSTISISESNQYFKVVDNVALYSKDGTILYAVALNSTTNLTIEEGCTTIKGTAFYKASFLSVTIPNTVKTIEQYAFWLADIEEVTFEEVETGDTTAISFGSYTFYNSNLMYLTLSSATTTLSSYFAYGAKYLKEVYNTEAVQSIGTYAFAYCYSLRQFDLYSGLITIGSNAFFSAEFTTLTIPSSVSSIAYGAFQGISTLTTVVFDDIENSQLDTINSFTFSSTGITSFTMPDSVTTLYGGSTFSYCYDLEEIYISKNVTSIPQYCFNYCTSLSTITFGPGVDNNDENWSMTVNSTAFNNCENLSQINFMGTQTQWDSFLDANSEFSETISLLIQYGYLTLTLNYEPGVTGVETSI